MGILQQPEPFFEKTLSSSNWPLGTDVNSIVKRFRRKLKGTLEAGTVERLKQM